MEQSLAYLHEILSNYTEENESIRDIDQQLKNKTHHSEETFVRGLDERQIQILTQILNKEMHHANESGDHERGYQLNEVFELLF